MDIPELQQHDRIGDDPSVMSIHRQVARGFIVLPTSSRSEHIPLLTGFSSAAAQDPSVRNPFIVDTSPFVPASVSAQKLLYRRNDVCRGSFQNNESTRKTRASEHTSVHLGVTVGFSFLGGGVSGSYDKAVLDNSEVSFAFPDDILLHNTLPTHNRPSKSLLDAPTGAEPSLSRRQAQMHNLSS